MELKVERLSGNPIIYPELDASIGSNINGPSLIRIPYWVINPLAKYYLYFAHHEGRHIRLAYADNLEGPWQIYTPGVLSVKQTPCRHHIASPDVHVIDGQIRMYFHGVAGDALNFQGQRSFVAFSRDGLHFEVKPEVLGPFYFRVFRHEDWYYALAKTIEEEGGGVLLRSPDGLQTFDVDRNILPKMRHAAVLKKENKLVIVFSRGHDLPEHLLISKIDLEGDWKTWETSEPQSLLKPEHGYEGANLPLKPSRFGAVHKRVNELRDPALFEDEGKLYLLYSVAGESGIAIAEIVRGL